MGPAIGFLLGYACLSIYIDPKLHPVITMKDPRWLGAWWLGWIILGITMALFAVLISMFPRDLPTMKTQENTSKQVIYIGHYNVIKKLKRYFIMNDIKNIKNLFFLRNKLNI